MYLLIFINPESDKSQAFKSLENVKISEAVTSERSYTMPPFKPIIKREKAVRLELYFFLKTMLNEA